MFTGGLKSNKMHVRYIHFTSPYEESERGVDQTTNFKSRINFYNSRNINSKVE